MHELRLLCPGDRVEPVSDALEMLEALSVFVEDAQAQDDAAQPLFGEPGLPPPGQGWPRSRIGALFGSLAGAQEASRLLQGQDFFAGCEVLGIAPVPDEDWVRLTQAQFAPVAITPEFWIVPSWHEPPHEARQVIRLDPGLAFGTGTHPTTRMCLRWIARHPPLGRRVLDYGCGSGILAIAAALFGAAQVDAVDIDPAAVEAAAANARSNQVQIRAGMPDQAGGRYELVLANILAMPLKLLAPLLCSHAAPGGSLVLAGILERQADEMKAAYAPLARLDVTDTDEGWVLMTASF